MKDIRRYYEEKYFDQDFSPQEKFKQYTKIEALKDFSKKSGIKGFGIVVGVGRGADLEVAPDGAVALDLPFTYLPLVKKSFPDALVVQGDGTMLPFKDEVFDWVVCSEVIEHVPDRDSMLREFWRVLKPDGVLILTTPNWINWFGLFRKIAELVSGRQVHANDQPIDNWTTAWALKKELSKYFDVFKLSGWWYFPPIGRGKFQLFPAFFAKLWQILMPLEYLCRKILPWFGHSIFIAAKPKKNK